MKNDDVIKAVDFCTLDMLQKHRQKLAGNNAGESEVIYVYFVTFILCFFQSLYSIFLEYSVKLT